jgi:hypothetical protein
MRRLAIMRIGPPFLSGLLLYAKTSIRLHICSNAFVKLEWMLHAKEVNWKDFRFTMYGRLPSHLQFLHLTLSEVVLFYTPANMGRLFTLINRREQNSLEGMGCFFADFASGFNDDNLVLPTILAPSAKNYYSITAEYRGSSLLV